MLTHFQIESMEILVGSVLAAAVVGAVILTLVGSLTYLLTQEPGSHSLTAPTAESEHSVSVKAHAA